jgi:DNA-directed RNA polymerase subunit alpha
MARVTGELETPVTDFELSVRSRNCLKKMNIRTLRDLLMITKAELLSYKNFGETSLAEIEAMLAQRGLRLGQGLDQGYVARAAKEYIDSLAERVDSSVLGRPVSTLELSVRARRALQNLGVQTIGELAARTEAELMGVKNFGQNSLDEIKRKLVDLGLSLRELD